MLWGAVPFDGVGSCRLFFTDDLHDTLSWVPASDKPHTFKSCFTHSSQVFFGRPGPFLPGTGLDLTLFISPLECMTCPNHLSRRSRTTSLTYKVAYYISEFHIFLITRNMSLDTLTTGDAIITHCPSLTCLVTSYWSCSSWLSLFCILRDSSVWPTLVVDGGIRAASGIVVVGRGTVGGSRPA